MLHFPEVDLNPFRSLPLLLVLLAALAVAAVAVVEVLAAYRKFTW